MDIVYLIHHNLGQIIGAILILQLPILLVSAIAISQWRKRSGKVQAPIILKEKKSNRLLTIIAICFVATWILMVSLTQMLTQHQADKFFALSKQTPAKLDFKRVEIEVSITEKSQIDAFFKLVKDAPDVGAHHSHPINDITLSIPGLKETYTLGQDSSEKDEYWLELGESEFPGEKGRCLKQFKSPELSDWLKSNGFPNKA